jgi:hypothetical protein
VPWSQFICATVLVLVGLGAFIYGTRLLVGRARLPWEPLRRARPGFRPDADPHLVTTVALISLTIGIISMVGGLGLLIISVL